MVISSSLARSNDQPLIDATRSTTSRGFMRGCSEKLIKDMPSPPCRSEWDAHSTARKPRRFGCGPPVEPIDRSGANHLRVEYNPLIPAAKAQLLRGAMNDWWIS